jgi:hypothetical protein
LGSESGTKKEQLLGYAKYGTPVRPVEIGDTYREALAVAMTEVTGYIKTGACLAINAGTGRPAVVQAISDATLAALLDYHPATAANDSDAASAFRYFPLREVESEQISFDSAPLYNLSNPRHREIILALMDQDDPVSSKDLHELINATKAPEQQDKYDTFRRHLYGVRRWLKHVPGFLEERGDRYRYRLR